MRRTEAEVVKCLACGMPLYGKSRDSLAFHLELCSACRDWYVEQDHLIRLPTRQTLVIPETVHAFRTTRNDYELTGVCPVGEQVIICIQERLSQAKAWCSRWLKIDL